MNCASCGAPLPVKTTICRYCNTRNDIDLNALQNKDCIHSDRTCPRCNIKLTSISLTIEHLFTIERCTECLGLFFDVGELEPLLEKISGKAYEINLTVINTIINESFHKDFPVMYLKCPVCKKLMNRINYGKKSGVIIDKCSVHGLWLDAGELRHLQEWTSAGGQILDQRAKEEKKHRDELELIWAKKKHEPFKINNRAPGQYKNVEKHSLMVNLLDLGISLFWK
jgi:Zn-finger nucleic acid-binding protein